MKFIYIVPLAAIIAFTIVSCSKTNNVSPSSTTKVDTSKSLIADKRLVGNWNIITDTVSLSGQNVKYHGSAGDYYKFTNYGNLYISEALNNLVDTAIYAVSSTTNQVSWINLYTSINGSASTLQSVTPPFTITHIDSVNLVLTQISSTAVGPRYEQITFKKKK